MINRTKLSFFILVTFLISCSKDNPDLVNPPTVVEVKGKLLDNFNIDYSKPSYFTSIPLPKVEYNYRTFSDWHPPLESILVDYDNDGILDLVEGNSDPGYYSPELSKFIFLKGTMDNTFVLDEINSNKYLGLVHGRKGIVGDFNSDSYPDLVFTDQGKDFDPWPGGHVVLFTNNGNGTFTETRFDSKVGYYHSLASGDLDNDGDLDILVLAPRIGDSYILFNNGSSFDLIGLRYDDNGIENNVLFYNYTNGNGQKNYFQYKYQTEIVDYDNDGYDDIFLAGHEFDEEGKETSPTVIVKGSSDGYHEILELPSIYPFGIVTDIDFFDLNSDGKLEIILTRSRIDKWYHDYFIQIIDGDSLLDVTYDYFDFGVNQGYSGVGRGWLFWVSIFEKDGEIILGSNDWATNIFWKFNQKFIRK